VINVDDNRGTTLIEVLVSIIILGMILTGFFQFFIFSQQTTTNNQEKLVAINIAQSVLEQIKGNAYPEITENSDTKIYDSTSVCTGSNQSVKNECLNRYMKTENNKDYSIEIEVDPKLSNGLHIVKVNVYGQGRFLESSVKGMIEL
jgi:prepilin-type N-terminal cleavage/methylation domain-containing protein